MSELDPLSESLNLLSGNDDVLDVDADVDDNVDYGDFAIDSDDEDHDENGEILASIDINNDQNDDDDDDDGIVIPSSSEAAFQKEDSNFAASTEAVEVGMTSTTATSIASSVISTSNGHSESTSNLKKQSVSVSVSDDPLSSALNTNIASSNDNNSSSNSSLSHATPKLSSHTSSSSSFTNPNSNFHQNHTNDTHPNMTSATAANLISKTQSFTSSFSSFASKAASSFQDAVNTAAVVGSSIGNNTANSNPNSAVNTVGAPSQANHYHHRSNAFGSVNSSTTTTTHPSSSSRNRPVNLSSSAFPSISKNGGASTRANVYNPNANRGGTSGAAATALSGDNKKVQEMDNAKKTSIVTSAIGTLLPGERVIMFLSHLTNIRDSSTPHTSIGSKGFVMDVFQSNRENESRNQSGNDNDNNTSEEIVWCCAMTFYRLVLFSYRESDFSSTTTITIAENVAQDQQPTSSTTANTTSVHDSPITDTVSQEELRNLIQTASISRQYQCYHSQTNSSKNQHYVIQIPLASIERIEKTTDFSSSSPSSGHTSSSLTSQLGGFHSNASALIKKSTISSIASHANHLNLNSAASSSSNNGIGVGGMVANSSLIIYGKDSGRYLRFTTQAYGDCMRAYEALNTYAFPGRRNLGYLFAFESRRAEVVGSVVTDANAPSSGNAMVGGTKVNHHRITARSTPRPFDPLIEYERMGILQPRTFPLKDTKNGTKVVPTPWKLIQKANASYNLCQSYPSIMVGPSTISDETPEGLRTIRKTAAFRSEGRMPTLTWASRYDGASLWRSAQPKVGLQGNRSEADELYLLNISKCAAMANENAALAGVGPSRKRPSLEFVQMLTGGINDSDLMLEDSFGRGSGGGSGGVCRMKIFDLRPKSAAMANRTAGYGYENTSNYANTTLSFHGIGNIHALRDSYQKITALCSNPSANDVQWAQLVEDTKWLYHVRLILSASWQTAFHIRYNRLPILVHCSHGWDRTSQTTALSQILLDEYYRTRAGFSCLIEKDFMAIGHPFHTRCGHGEGKGDRSAGPGSSGQSSGDEGQIAPVFIQFLDCVFQIVNQFPDYFEFNTKYLLLLSEHVYSCRFGTLLCDTEREREKVASIRQRTHCLWEYLDSCPDLVNQSYSSKVLEGDDPEECGALMMPLPTLLRNVTLWVERHCMHGPKPTLRCLPAELSNNPISNSTIIEGKSNEILGEKQPDQALYGRHDLYQLSMRLATEEAIKWKKIAEQREKEVESLKTQLAQTMDK